VSRKQALTDPDPLAGIVFVSAGGLPPFEIGGFRLDPRILLPIELPRGSPRPAPADISWQAIISAMLKILAYRPAAEHAEYYRRFILAAQPDIKEEFTRAGILKAEQGELELAVEIFRSMAGLFPGCGRTLNNLALVYEQLAQDWDRRGEPAQSERHEELAFDAYKAALAAEPELAACHLNFAHFYLRRGNPQKAREHLDRFLKYNTDPEKTESARILLRRLEAAYAAEQACAEALDAIQAGREQAAIERLTPVAGAHPGLWNAWFLLGWAHRRLGNYQEGKRAFLAALEGNRGSPDLYNELAICLMELGELEESRRHLEEARRLAPGDAKILSNLGVLALKRGDAQEARRLFEAVLELAPDDPIARRYLG
jgi:tetratricopeptide (TPR) repeat protein